MSEVPATLWKPTEDDVKKSNMTKLMNRINEKHKLSLTEYDELWRWSVDNISEFWEECWDYFGIVHSKPFTQVVDDLTAMPGAKFFTGARLNFAENMLRFRDDRPAYRFYHDCSRQPRVITYRELYGRVAVMVRALRASGFKPGDVAAGFVPNIPEAAVAMLAVTACGGVWSSCSPDFGAQGVLDRFSQIKPRIMFTTEGYFFKGKRLDILPKAASIASQLPSLEKVIVFNYTLSPDARFSLAAMPLGEHAEDFIGGHEAAAAASPEDESIRFEQMPFDAPVYIMFSSGTTGLPKCIVQGFGVLLNHMKELEFHCDLTRDDNMFYFTTTGWMMWNWLTSSLSLGCCIVLFDGNPLSPTPDALWELAEKEEITVFGTSARYLSAVQAEGVVPSTRNLSRLRAILSTGSPATANTFDYVYNQIKPDVQFCSISGGTDLNGCFALGCPTKPVYPGELQCLGLGLEVSVWDDVGERVEGVKGELVCLKPFPSMPLFFWDDEPAGENAPVAGVARTPVGSRYHGAYFDTYPGVWRHGDFAELTPRGGLIIYGRSDATLNPGGVRIGTADIYRVAEEMAEVKDSVVVGQSVLLPDGTPDVRVLLFVVMAEGVELTEVMKKTIRKKIATECSPRHAPALVVACPSIPYTVSGKKVELAVKKMVQGEPVVNRSALANPTALDFFGAVPEIHGSTPPPAPPADVKK